MPSFCMYALASIAKCCIFLFWAASSPSTPSWTDWKLCFSPERLAACSSSVSSKKRVPYPFYFSAMVTSISQFSIKASVFKFYAWNPYGHTMDARTPDMETHDNVCVCHFVSIKHPSEGCHQRQKSHKAMDTFLTPLSNPRDLWPLRHLIRVMRRHDLTKLTILGHQMAPLALVENLATRWSHLH